MPTKPIQQTEPITKGNAFFGGASSSVTHKAKAPTTIRPVNRYSIHLVTFHGVDTLINNYENLAAARRSMMAATESSLTHYRKCTFELHRLSDDVIIQTAKHKSLLR